MLMDDFVVVFPKVARAPDDLLATFQPCANRLSASLFIHPDGLAFLGPESAVAWEGSHWCAATGGLYPANANVRALTPQEVLKDYRDRGDLAVLDAGDGVSAAIYADHRLKLYRDAFGRSSLYVWETPQAWTVVSNAHLLRKLPGWRTVLSGVGLGSFFVYDRPLPPFTIFDGVTKVPPGSMMTLPGGKMSCVWTPQAEPALARVTGADAREWIETRIKSTLRRSPQDGAGIFFSGGFDSSLLVALALEEGLQLPSQTLLYSGPRNVTENAITSLANRLHAKTQFAELPVDINPLVDAYCLSAQEPDASTGICALEVLHGTAPFCYCLNGVGSGPIFMGYSGDHWPVKEDRWRRFPPFLARDLVRALGDGAVLPHLLAGDEMGFCRIASQRTTTRERRRLIPSRLIGPQESRQLTDLFGHPRCDLTGMELVKAINFTFLRVNVNRVQAYTDIAAHHGHRLLYPFFDRQLVEYVLRLPVSVSLKDLDGKYLVKECMRQRVPQELILRQPIHLPIASFLKRNMDAIKDEFLGPNASIAEYVRSDILDRWLMEFASGRESHKRMLWRVLLMSRWLRHWA